MKECYECGKSVSAEEIKKNWERMGDEIVIAYYMLLNLEGADEVFVEDESGEAIPVICEKCIDKAFREYKEA